MSGEWMEFWNGAVVNGLGWTLVHSVWEGAAVALVVGVALRMLRRGAATVRYGVASVGLVVMVCLVVGTFFALASAEKESMGVAHFENARAAAVGSGEGTTESQRAQRRTEDFAAGSARAGEDGAVHLMKERGVAVAGDSSGQSWRERGTALLGLVTPAFPWIVGIWMMGVVVLSVWHVGGWVAVQRMRRVGVRAAGERVEGMVRRLSERMGVTRVVRVMGSAVVGVPVAVGHWRPLVLVPVGVLSGLSVEQLEAILAHELAHIRRHDYVVNLLQTVVETVLFYHPAVWWISRRVREEREHCCDDVASAVCGDRVVYTEALLRVEEMRGPGLAMAASGGGVMLGRVRRLVEGKALEVGSKRRSWSLAGVGMVALLVLLPMWGTRRRALAENATTQGTVETVIHGKLLEVGTEKPVAGARVDANCVGHEGIVMTTDGNGEFSCKVAPGEWQFEFRQEGAGVYLSAAPEDRLSRVAVALDGSVKERAIALHIPPVRPVGGIHGKVVMPDGSPAAGMLVVPSAENEAHTITSLIYLDAKKTDADGSFKFGTAPAGAPVDLYAETGDHKLAFVAEVNTKANMGDEDVGTFKLGPTTGCDVLITDAHKQPLANERINVQPTFGDNGLGNMNRKFTTDERGHLVADGLLPGLQYKVGRPATKSHVDVVLVGQGAVTSAVLDKYFAMRVVDGTGKGVAVSGIKLITVKISEGEWRLGKKPEVLGRLEDETVLVDPKQLILARSGQAVTMRFLTGAGETVIARGTYTGDLSGMELRAEEGKQPGVVMSAKAIAVGKGDFGGRVVDDAGSPVAGAVISVPNNSPPFEFGKMKVVATTDGAGEFHIVGSLWRFYLQVDKEGFARRWLLQRDLPSGKPIDVVLEGNTRVAMGLKMADGTPAAGAVLTGVTILEERSGEMKVGPFEVSAVADRAGHVELPVSAGTWEFRAGWKEQEFADLAEVKIRAGEVLKKEVVLEPGVRVKVRAVDSQTGEGIVGVKLAFEKQTPGQIDTVRETEVTTAADGTAEWVSVGPWLHGINWNAEGYARCLCDQAAWPDQRGIDGVRLKVVPGMQDVVLKMERGVKLTGRVVDGSGKGVEKVWVNAGGLQTGDRRYMRETNGKGEFALLVPASNGYHQQMYRVEVFGGHNDATAIATTEEFLPEVGETKTFEIQVP